MTKHTPIPGAAPPRAKSDSSSLLERADSTFGLEGFGVEIHYHTRTEKSGFAYKYHSSLLEMANAVDTLISIVPGTSATTKSINAEILKALGSDGVFINVGRGSVADEDALIEALQNKTIAAAGLDVFENEPDPRSDFFTLDNVSMLHPLLFTPEMRWATFKLIIWSTGFREKHRYHRCLKRPILLLNSRIYRCNILAKSLEF